MRGDLGGNRSFIDTDVCGCCDGGQKGLILMHGNEYSKKIVKMIGALSYKHSTWQVFSDFVEIMAVTLSNAVDKYHFEEREKSYFEIMARYQAEEFKQFAEVFGLLILALEDCAQAGRFEDVLGRIFHELELHNKYKGQFFTPQDICDLMGQVATDDSLGDKIADKGYVTLLEPTCGSGAMVLGWVNGMKKQGLDWSTEVCVMAMDVDLKCAHMTYVQLALYGIPAVVIHGDSLSLKQWSRWYTPIYLLNGWYWRESCDLGTGRDQEVECFKRADQPLYGLLRDLDFTAKGSEQGKDQGVTEQVDLAIEESDSVDEQGDVVGGEIDFVSEDDQAVSENGQIAKDRTSVVLQAPQFGFEESGQMMLF